MLDFLVIGAQKSGTTWLYRELNRHQRISFPGGKEVHFWDLFRSRGIPWYLELFSLQDGKIHGDVTPAYSVLPIEIIHECQQHFPDIRLIYSMRNPIERAWSAAKMDAVKLGMNVPELPDSWFISHFLSVESMARGDYERCIKNWLSFYPRKKLLLLRFEEITTNPEAYINRCLMHLGLETLTPAKTSGTHFNPTDSSELRKKVREGHPAALRPSLQAVLEDIYHPRIKSLASYLGEDFAEWLS